MRPIQSKPRFDKSCYISFSFYSEAGYLSVRLGRPLATAQILSHKNRTNKLEKQNTFTTQLTSNKEETNNMSIRSASNSLRDPSLAATLDLEQQIALVNDAIRPLRKVQKKLAKLEDELANTNNLIDSGIGSRADKAALRQTKKQLRQQRVQMWKQLEALPALLDEHKELLHQLDILRRQHDIL